MAWNATGSLEGGRDPGWGDIEEIVLRAEDVGFDSVWVPDELHWRAEGQADLAFWEGWTLLAALAATTSRVRLGTLVCCTNYRNPALLAKMAATVDEISRGRLVLGLGAGWSTDQFEMFGYEADHLFDRFEESLGIILGLLRDGHVTFEGRYQRTRDAALLPAGPRPGGIPILLGVEHSRGMRLAARHADTWNAFLPRRDLAVEIPRLCAELDAACAAEDRDPATLARTVSLMALLEDVPFVVQGSDWTERALRGSSDEIAAGLRSIAAMGIEEVQVGVVPYSLAGIERFGRVLEAL
jgi:alkanesulfonate monooxygenase SsuD/methylene tetrahydromethanopterin reductase-like flavin-dependent oxidoreductase (luciferase family)